MSYESDQELIAKLRADNDILRLALSVVDSEIANFGAITNAVSDALAATSEDL